MRSLSEIIQANRKAEEKEARNKAEDKEAFDRATSILNRGTKIHDEIDAGIQRAHDQGGPDGADFKAFTKAMFPPNCCKMCGEEAEDCECIHE